FDVLIAGAGPAGCATALSLASFAPRLRVGLIDGAKTGAKADAKPGTPRVGEAVPPQIMPMLRHLGVTADFAGDRHHAAYRTMSAWGSRALASNEFLFQIHQTGWRLDRARFDAMLLRAAARSATVISGRAVGLDHDGDRWRVQLADGRAPAARAA